jgi:hypothetical protein
VSQPRPRECAPLLSSTATDVQRRRMTAERIRALRSGSACMPQAAPPRPRLADAAAAGHGTGPLRGHGTGPLRGHGTGPLRGMAQGRCGAWHRAAAGRCACPCEDRKARRQHDRSRGTAGDCGGLQQAVRRT